MTGGIFLFELVYRGRRRVNYIFFGVIFFTSLFVAASPNPLPAGFNHPNAPALLTLYTALLSFFFTLISAAIMGAPVIRDVDHGFEPLLYTTTVQKGSYLAGRFLGSFTVLVVINCAMPLGLMAGHALADIVPWRPGWQGHVLLPFNAWSYITPFLFFNIPNLFVTGAIYFAGGALSRRSLVIYTQGVVLLIFYQIGYLFSNQDVSGYILGALDPFGIQVVQQSLKFWSEGDINNLQVPLSNVLLFNRILWFFAGVICLVATRYFFKMCPAQVQSGVKELPEGSVAETPVVPFPARFFTARSTVIKILHSAGFYVRIVTREIPFIAFTAAAALLLLVNVLKVPYQAGGENLMTSYSAITLLNPFNTVISMMILFYSGELLWIEKNSRIDLVWSSLPIPEFLEILSKMAALVFICIVILVGSVLCAIAIQFGFGYYLVDPEAWLVPVFLGTLPNMMLTMILSVFLQVLANNKFLGFTLCILAFLLISYLGTTGMENELLRFGSGTLVDFSGMNGYTNFLFPYLALKLYWLSIGVIMIMVSFLWISRGASTTFRARLQEGRRRADVQWRLMTGAAVAISVGLAVFIYYKTHIEDHYESASDVAFQRREYASRFQRFHNLPQPEIVREEITVSLDPQNGKFTANGELVLKNNNSSRIPEVLIQSGLDPLLRASVETDRKVSKRASDRSGKIQLLSLEQPLEAGEEMKLNFKVTYANSGFLSRRPAVIIVRNGAFVPGSVFPKVGYDPEMNPDIPQQPSLYASRKNKGSDGRLILHITTDDDQHVIAPGRLEGKFSEKGRTEFTFTGAIPFANQFAIISGEFKDVKTRWRDKSVTVSHYHAREEIIRDVGRTVDAALTRCAALFSDIPAGDITVVEVPCYNKNPITFAGVIPLAEDHEFISRAPGDSAVYPLEYNIMCSTVRHWMDEFAGAGDATLLRQTFPNFYALRFIRNKISKEALINHNKGQLKNYLTGRQTLAVAEPPLSAVSGLKFIYDTKATLGLYRLEEVMGPALFDAALLYFRDQYRAGTNTARLPESFGKFMPDSSRYLIRDIFETVTVYDNSLAEASYTPEENGTYTLSLRVWGHKSQLNDRGNDIQVPFSEWIDIGIYSRDAAGKLVVSIPGKVRIHEGENRIRMVIRQRPESVTVDPYSSWIDAQPDNNSLQARQTVDLTDVGVQ